MLCAQRPFCAIALPAVLIALVDTALVRGQSSASFLGQRAFVTGMTPVVGPGGETLTFALTVCDGSLVSDPDTVAIQVVNVNDPII